MVRILTALFLLGFASLTNAGTALAAEPKHPAIEAVITRQLEAFSRGDRDAAFAIASPSIQAMFGDAATFLTMVETGYRTLARPDRHRFLDLQIVAGRLVQRVLVDGRDGATVVARYEMIEIDGGWRINGCTLEKGEAA